MIKLPRSEAVVVVVLLGLSLVLGSEDASLAAGFQRDDGVGEVLSVKLAYYDLAELDPLVTSAMQAEVKAIFDRIGVSVEWVDTLALSNGSGPAENSYLKVMLCAKPYSTWELSESAMGHAPGEEFPRPTVYVFDSRVREALDRGKRRFVSADPENMGRALGRAMAHEVVHALTPEPFHTRSGLMRAAHDCQTLTCPEAEVDDKSVAELRRGLTLMQELSLGTE